MRNFVTLFLALVSSCLAAQTLTVSQNQLNFGNTFENAPDSIQLTITNPGTAAVNVTGMRFYKLFGSNPFTVNDSVFTLAASASRNVWVKFSPLHNVAHNLELVILNSSHRGNVSVDLIGQGKYSKSYYTNTENLSEQTLKDTLQAITGRGYVSLGYNGGRDKMFMNVDNKKLNGQGAATNTIECVYTGRNAVGYTSRSNCQSAFSFNTEHTYPQGYFNSAEPMQSDLFHLYPTDDNANNVRSSFRFGVVTGTPTWTDGGSKFGGVFFEPRDQHKGEVARAMFYFVVRYQNYQGFLTTQENTLRTWMKAFPPNTIEIKREADIFFYQKNHNPFIVYPQFIDRISSISNTSVAPVIASIDLTDSIIDYGFVSPFAANVYNYVIVNKGNTPVAFSNLSLTNTTLFSFANGTGSNASLQPGEALKVQISLTTANSDSLVEYFNFTTDIPSLPSVSIPIFVNYSQLPLNVATFTNSKPEMALFPNPSNGAIKLNYKLNAASQGKFLVYNLLGKLVFEQELDENEQSIDLNFEGFSGGVYTCELRAGITSEFKKLILLRP